MSLTYSASSSTGASHQALSLDVQHWRLHADVWAGGEKAYVLLLHGLGGNSITWQGVAPILARELGARVLALDLPRFGASRPGQQSISMRALTRVVFEVMEQQGPSNQRWFLAGNSLGGLLALELACRFPERVAAITLAALALPLSWGRRFGRLTTLAQYFPLGTPWVGRRLVTARSTRRLRRTHAQRARSTALASAGFLDAAHSSHDIALCRSPITQSMPSSVRAVLRCS